MVIVGYVESLNFLILLKEKAIMYKRVSSLVFILIVSLFFVCSLSFAQGPKYRPPGWDKGEKRGWGSDVPPGLEKKKQERKDKWDSLTDEEGAAKKEAWKEKRQERKDKWDSLTDEEGTARKGLRNTKQEARMAKWKAERDRKRAEWAAKREAGEAE